MTIHPAMVLAGYSSEKPDPLALAVGRQRKSLIDVAGKPMVSWVVSALRKSSRVGKIAVVGVMPEDGLDLGSDILYVPNQERHFDNIMAGISALQQAEPSSGSILVTSADIPLLRAETVDWVVDRFEQLRADFVYTIVEQRVMETQYPGAARSYVPIAEGKFCGGDLHYVRASVARNNEELVRKLLERRKNAFQQIRLAGFGTIIKFLFRRLTIRDAERVASRLMQCNARALNAPFADLGMDVDKPHQLDMVRRLLAGA